jgi:hypothetical protein
VKACRKGLSDGEMDRGLLGTASRGIRGAQCVRLVEEVPLREVEIEGNVFADLSLALFLSIGCRGDTGFWSIEVV